MSFGEVFKGHTVIKYNRKDYEGLTHADEESTPPPTVRHRTKSRVAAVSPDNRASKLSTKSVFQSDKLKENRYLHNTVYKNAKFTSIDELLFYLILIVLIQCRQAGCSWKCVNCSENIFSHFLLP